MEDHCSCHAKGWCLLEMKYTPEDRSFLTIRDIVTVLFHRKTIILTVTGTATVIGIVVAFLTPPVYQANSELLVKRASLATNDPPLSQNIPVISANMRQLNREEEVNTEIALIQSRDLVVKVIDSVALTQEQLERIPDVRRYVRMVYKGVKEFLSTTWNETKYFLHLSERPTAEALALRKRERFIADVREALIVEQVPDSDIIRISFRCNDPVLAQKMSLAFLTKAVGWHVEMRAQSQNLLFFQQQAQDSRGRLEDIERELVAARRNLDLVGAEDRQKLLIEHQLQVNARLNDIRRRETALITGIGKLKELLREEPSVIPLTQEFAANPVWQKLSTQLATLHLQKIEAATKFTDHGRHVKDIDAALEGGNKILDSTPPHIENRLTEGINAVHQTLREKILSQSAELAALTAEGETANKQVSDFDNRLQAINENIYRIKALERQRELLESSYKLYLQNTEQAKVSEDRQRAQISELAISQRGGLPLSPMKPRKWLYILIAVAGGTILSISLAFTVEFSDTTIGREDELETLLDVPSLGSLSKL